MTKLTSREVVLFSLWLSPFIAFLFQDKWTQPPPCLVKEGAKKHESTAISHHPRLQRQVNQIPNENRTLAFVHVGKTGGTTLEFLLGQKRCDAKKIARHVCEKKSRPNKMIPSALARAIKRTFHTFAIILPENYTSFLVTTRDPYERAISAFLMQHPRNNVTVRRNRVRRDDYVFDCFPTLEDFARNLDPNNNNEDNANSANHSNWHSNVPKYVQNNITAPLQSCQRIAHDAIHGVRLYSSHLYFNYNYYLGGIPMHRKEFFAIRLTHFGQDVGSVNDILKNGGLAGGRGNRTDGGTKTLTQTDNSSSQHNEKGDNPKQWKILHTRDSKSMNYTVNSTLSAQGAAALCQALRREYQLYFEVLERAVNLQLEDVQEMYEESHKNCPGLFVET